jgi:two-component system chemotaxis response regulator CheB
MIPPRCAPCWLSRLSGHADIQVVGAAATRRGARLIKAPEPDVVTLDIEMPGMNGWISWQDHDPAAHAGDHRVRGDHQGAEVTARALALGACCSKADITVDRTGGDACPIWCTRPRRSDPARPGKRGMAGDGKPGGCPRRRSTTGPDRDRRIDRRHGGPADAASRLSTDCPPTDRAARQRRFVPAIANSLNAACDAEVVVAEPDMPLHPGHVYIAPGDHRHMRIGGTATPCIKLRTGDPVAGTCPAWMRCCNRPRRPGAMPPASVLTGMGCDGAQGLLAMARAGAKTIAQDEATSTVWDAACGHLAGRGACRGADRAHRRSPACGRRGMTMHHAPSPDAEMRGNDCRAMRAQPAIRVDGSAPSWAVALPPAS